MISKSFQDVCTQLMDNKGEMSVKIATISELLEAGLKELCRRHIQFLLDWLSSTLQFLSKTDKYIEQNANEIGQLLSIFASVLNHNNKANLACVVKVLTLEVLGKLCTPANSNKLPLSEVWKFILEYSNWMEKLPIKLTTLVEVIVYFCERIMEGETAHHLLLEDFLRHYVKAAGKECNIRKVFNQFCERLLSLLMAVNSQNNLQIFDDVIKAIVLKRAHVASLDCFLSNREKIEEVDEPQAKKRKKENDAYFSLLFKSINLKKYEVQASSSIPRLYDITVKTIRSCPDIDGKLSSYNQFELFMLLAPDSKFIEASPKVAVVILSKLLKVISQNNVYERVTDGLQENKQFEWMKNIFHKFLALSDRLDEQNSLCSCMTSLLQINHYVIETRLNDVWRIALKQKSSTEEQLLSVELITTYHKLHQLDKLLNEFSFDDEVQYNNHFIDSYSSIIEELELRECTNLLKLYLQKLPNVTNKASLTYLLCYLVLQNSCVVPTHGYMKTSLQTFISTMRDVQSTSFKCKTSSLLIRLTASNVNALLRNFHLQDEVNGGGANEDDIEFSGKCSPLESFLTASLGLTSSTENLEKKFKYFEKICVGKVTKQAAVNLLAIDDETIGHALLNLICGNLTVLLRHLPRSRVILQWFMKACWHFQFSSWKFTKELCHYNNEVFQSTLTDTIVESIASHQKDPDTLCKYLKEVSTLPLVWLTGVHVTNIATALLNAIQSRQADGWGLCFVAIINAMVACKLVNVDFDFIKLFSMATTQTSKPNEDLQKLIICAVVKCSNRETTITLVNEVLKSSKEKPLLLDATLGLFNQLLEEIQVGGRCEQTIFSATHPLAQRVLNETLETSLCNLTRLLRIVQHCNAKKGENHPLKELEEPLLAAVRKYRHNKIEVGSLSKNELGDNLDLLQVVYQSNATHFAQQIQKELSVSEEELCKRLTDQTFSQQCDEEGGLSSEEVLTKRNQFIACIVLNANVEKLQPLLQLLCDSLANAVESKDISIIKLWTHLLNSKWTKEQRIVLWQVFPMVLMVSVQCISGHTTTYAHLTSLEQIVALVNISKNSMMSNYITCIYHVFPIVFSFIKTNSKRLVELFGCLYGVVSQLLFHHNAPVYATLPLLVKVTNNLLCILTEHTHNCTAAERTTCCEKLSRLYNEIGSHKEAVSKYTPYIVTSFVQKIQNGSLTVNDKETLVKGIYFVLDTCADSPLLSAHLAEGAYREQYKQLLQNFNKHHKYTGKA